MATMTFTASDVTLRSTKATASSVASVETAVRDIVVTGLTDGDTVTRAVLSVTVEGVGAYGTNMAQCTVNGTDVRSGGQSTPGTNSIRMQIESNRTLTLTFVYQMSQYVSGTQYTVYFKDITLTIEYTQGGQQPYTDNRVLIPQRGVSVLGTTVNTPSVKLHPTSCVVTEAGNGEYELEMEHPKDPEGRWQLLMEERLLRAAVPPFVIPAVSMPVRPLWETTTVTPLYTKLPTYASAKKTGIEGAASNPSSYQWNNSTLYASGAVVTTLSGGVYTIWKANQANQNRNPQGSDNVGNAYWSPCGTASSGTASGGTGTYDPGVIKRQMAANERFTLIAYYSATYIRIRTQMQEEGYVRVKDCQQTAQTSEVSTAERVIYNQLFRIYAVSCDDASGLLTVNARHISYDLQGNALFDCQAVEADPATAIAQIQGNMINADSRDIICPLETPHINADWSFGNPLQALLDPDDGVAGQLKAKVLRDNADFFILSGEVKDQRQGPRLSYGVNLRGVSWERSTEDLITRIIPRAKDGDDYLYLDELYIDSAHIGDYPYIRVEFLDSEYSVKQKIKKADGTEQTLSRSDVIERMRQEAENRYYTDRCDAVTVSLDVDFTLLGDTEEYRQYRNLQRVNLFDILTIDTGSMETTAQVISYEWDCLLGRYNGISIGKVYSQSRRIPGYRVATGAITYSKLSPGLISWIKGSES